MTLKGGDEGQGLQASWARVYLFHIQEVYLCCPKVPKEGDPSSRPCEEPQRVPPTVPSTPSLSPEVHSYQGLAWLVSARLGKDAKSESSDEDLRPDTHPRSHSW